MTAGADSSAIVLGFALFAGSVGLAQAPGKPTSADIIFTHGMIYTGEGLAEGKPRVIEAIAIGGSKVLAVGSDEEVLRMAGSKTQIRDLSATGKQVFVFPGINDAHAHLGELGRRLLKKVTPQLTPEERRRGLELAIADRLAHGVTSVIDFSTPQDFLAFEQLEREGKLNLRITEWLPFQDSIEQINRITAGHDPNDPMLHVEFLKGLTETPSESSFGVAGMVGLSGSHDAAAMAPSARSAEQYKGKLIPGSDADFILADRDLNTVPAPGLPGTKVLETYVAGRQAFVAGMHIR